MSQRREVGCPPLALVRSRICATSVVNDCVDDAKPATVFDWRGPVCFFLTVEKEEATLRTINKLKLSKQKGSPLPPCCMPEQE